MGLLTFILYLLIAAAAAGVHTLIVGWAAPPGPGRAFTARFVAYAMLLTLPALLPRLLGG